MWDPADQNWQRWWRGSFMGPHVLLDHVGQLLPLQRMCRTNPLDFFFYPTSLNIFFPSIMLVQRADFGVSM